jgi:hypothetical protein
MAEEYHNTDLFRGARFTSVNLGAATFRSCDFRGVTIVDAMLVDLSISGLVSNLVVNDVDVTAYVTAELERRRPERAQLREVTSADDYRAMWDTIERLWAEVADRVRRLPEPARQERVEDEWSIVETLRHLVFVTDAWACRTVLDDPMPYDRLGFTHTGYPPRDAATLGIDLDARPSFDEVMAVRIERMAIVRQILDGLADADLGRLCSRSPAPGYPEEPRTVGHCLRAVMDEECEHYRYTDRDLSVLEARLEARG